MSIILFRSLLLYILVIFAVRLMGKRQLGELQPSELVITILVSNIATLPLEDVNIPVIVGVTPILSLVCIEVIMSWLILRFPKLRKMVSGSPKIIIRNGVIDVNTLKELRLSVDDLMTAMRGSDVFDPNEVQYAIVETTGSFSVMKKQSDDTPVRSDLLKNVKCEDPPVLVVSDGKILDNALSSLGFDVNTVENVLKRAGKKLDDVLLMTAEQSGKCYIAWNDGGKPFADKVGDCNDKS